MEIIDSQVHVWQAASPGWEPHGGRSSFTAEELLDMMAEAGVDRAVLVPPTWDPHGNQGAIEAAARHPGKFVVFGEVDVHEEVTSSLLPTWLDTPGMHGIRVAFRREPYATWLIDGTTDWLWGAAEDAGIPVMAYTPGRLGLIGEIARRHPRLRLLLDHMCIHPFSRGIALRQELDQLLPLARHDNLAVKVSALPMYSQEGMPFADTHEMVRRIVSTFGATRSFWGTDVTRLPCTYSEAVEMFTEHIDGLSTTDLELVMGKAFRDWLPWH